MKMANRLRILRLAKRLDRYAAALRAYEKKQRPKRAKKSVP